MLIDNKFKQQKMTNKELIKKMKLGSHLSRYQYLVYCLYSIVIQFPYHGSRFCFNIP